MIIETLKDAVKLAESVDMYDAWKEKYIEYRKDFGVQESALKALEDLGLTV